MKEIGTVISTPEGPSSMTFSFVINDEVDVIPIRKGQFVELKTKEGKLVATVSDVYKTNQYFARAESVREYERSGKSLTSIYPAARWEYTVAEARPLAVYNSDGLDRATFPPSPGEKIYLADERTLQDFIGLDREKGLFIGSLRFHGLQVKLSLTRLLQKHVAILAISGAGKSYLASVLIEELVNRTPEHGRVAVVVIDAHGEYTGFAKRVEDKKYTDYSDRTQVFESKEIQIGVPNLSPEQIAEFIPDITPPQKRELARIIKELKARMYSGGGPFDLRDLMSRVVQDEQINIKIKETLVSWLENLETIGLFGRYDNPPIDQIAKPGQASIIDLSGITNLRKKQIIVNYLSRRLFNLRRDGKIPPYVEIIEEAHQFCPEAGRGSAISKGIIETIAREGRKFYASLCLISQRPVRLSTTVLSQCNSHIILRVTNPYDLEHIGKSSEGITRDVLDAISTLKIGEALIVGEAVNYPIFVRIRERNSYPSEHGVNLEKAALMFEEKTNQQQKDAGAFI
ncbi:MAG: ATP-binding protein [Euryarchaeota archaeon]|nr:ATP-binding protein [Euryarchaeota archaeon]